MLEFKRVLCAISLALAASAAVTSIVPPASQGVPASSDNTLDPNASTTDTDTIVQTVNIVDQKDGANDDTPPNQPVPETVVTAVDGELTAAGSSSSSTRKRSLTGVTTRSDLTRRIRTGYEQVFAGTGTGPNDRDASIQGTAYLTYTVVPNSTYSVDACLDFCTRVDGCVFANIYYEYNNDLLDFVFSEKSNLKCAIYGDVHSAAEKTNFGGQQLLPPPAGLTYIQQSSGFAATSLADPDVPDGYELVFGPTNGANNAPGYMGFVFLDKYDVDACAQQCNSRGADSVGGACQYFNIWRAVVNGNPTTYTCSMYYLPSDASTAVNYGQGDLVVTYSRGYRRKNYVVDGGFEGYTCDSNGNFCYAASYSDWVGTSAQGGTLDATVFHFTPYAHSGAGSVILGSATGVDNLAGTITPSSPLNTVAGKKYQISFFQQSTYSGPSLQANAFFEVHWNGDAVATVNPGFTPWKFYSFEVTAQGNDVFAIHGGKAPAWSFIDDIAIYEI